MKNNNENAQKCILGLNRNEIMYFKALGNCAKIFYINGKTGSVPYGLAEIERTIDDDDFFRCHKSYLVNFHFIMEYCIVRGKVIFANNKKLPVSRRKKDLFAEYLLRKNKPL
jgi:two-component system LytT family response regulator